MLSAEERDEIRAEVFRDLAEIEADVAHRCGSFTHLCVLAGEPVFTHHAVGAVIRHIPHGVV